MKKRGLALMIAVALLFSITPFNASKADAATSYTTKTSVEKRIKTLNSQISKLEKTYKTQLNEQKRQKKGAKPIYGDIQCYDPFIVKQAYTLGTYYWISNPEKLENSFLIATGYAKPTGQYKNWNGITCTVAKAVYVSDAANKTKKKIDSKKKERTKLKKSLTDAPEISGKISELRVGDSYALSASMKNNTGKYNKLSWSSSNSAVCTVKNGKLTGMAPGTCTIKVKASVSKKTASLKINVVENNGEPIQYGDHKIVISESNVVLDNPGAIDIEIQTGEDLEEISYKLCDINGNDIESGVSLEFSEWDGDTIYLSIWPDSENCQYGQYKVIIYETNFPSNCETIYVTVEENAGFSG